MGILSVLLSQKASGNPDVLLKCPCIDSLTYCEWFAGNLRQGEIVIWLKGEGWNQGWSDSSLASVLSPPPTQLAHRCHLYFVEISIHMAKYESVLDW